MLSLLVPVGVWLYLRGRKKKAPTAVMHPNLDLILKAQQEGKRKVMPLATIFYFLACLVALLALARPTFGVPVADPRANIVLAVDVSLSMAAYDILPNRFEAAKTAVKAFIKELPEGTQVGLISFAGYTSTLAPPSQNHEQLLEQVDFLRMDYGTVIGDAMLASLAALPSLEERERLDEDPSSLANIILLSDGRSTGGIHPLEALEELKRQQVTVHTIGVGTLGDGPVPGIPARYQWAARFDEVTMKRVAEETGGEFVFVESAEALKDVYKNLNRDLVWRLRREEATAFVALAAAILLFISLSLRQLQRQLL